MRRFFERLLSLLWTSFAVLLIASAALVTLVRMLLPQIGERRDTVEAWLTEMIGRPVQVGAISANWSGWAPRLSIDRLVILDEHSNTELIHFEHADIDIAPLASLRQRALKPTRLTVSGVAMSLIRDLNGQLSVAGMPPPRSPVIRWLLEQDNFTVRRGNLTVEDQRAQESFALSDLTLAIHSHGAAKIITAYVDLPARIGRHLALEIRTKGNPLDAHWEGSIDARLDGINSGYWLRQADWHGSLPSEVPCNLVAWSQWRDGILRHSDFELAVETSRDDARHLLEARGQLLRRDQSWRLALADITLPGVANTKSNGRLTAVWRKLDGQEPVLALRAAALPIAPLATLATQLSAPGALRDALVRGLPRGRLTRLDALWTPRSGMPPRYFIAARVSGLEVHDAQDDRDLEHLSFALMANGGGGHVAFDDDAFQLRDGKHLLEPLAVEALHGALSWRSHDTQPLTVRAHALQAQVAGNTVVLDGTLTQSADTSPQLDLSVQLTTTDARRLKSLLPLHVLPPHGEAWLQQLFESGRVERGQIVIRGPLDHFPYADQSGEFSADFSIRDATLRYGLQWPVAKDFDGEMTVRANRLAVKIGRGTISGADIAGADIVLADFMTHQRMLRVTGTARGPGASAIALVRDSPLKNGKAARLEDLDINDAIEVELAMDLALYRGGPHEVQGTARFKGNRIAAHAQHIILDEMVGEVSFGNSGWHGEGLRAVFDGTPVDVEMSGGVSDPNYDTEFRLAGVSTAAGVLDYLKQYVPPVHAWLNSNQRLASFSGSVPWQAVLSVPSAAGMQAELPQRLVIESNLTGLGIDLPWPFGKQAGAQKPLRIETAIHDHLAVKTRVDLRNTMSMEIDIARGADGQPRLTRTEAVFGSLDPQFKGKLGVTLSGYIPLLPLNEWTPFVQHMPDVASGYTDTLPISFDVQVTDLRMLGRRFKDQRLVGTRGDKQWSLTVSGGDVGGEIEIPRDISAGVLRLDLDHLHLRRALTHATASKAAELDPRRLPAFEMRCAEFRYGKIELGQADISTSRHADGLTLDHLRFSSADFTIGATGDWLVSNDAHRSNFNISVQAKALGTLLKRFGYGVANIKHGDTDIEIQANWAGTPADFALAHINGSFEIDVTNGRFLDLEPGTGRLFGLLSLQALPRRLTLNFEDLFDKGFAFDRIAGVFQLQDGNAYTNNLVIEGPSARFDIAGRTGLAAKDYDQHIVVTPTLSNSLPLAGALFGPIGAGAGAAYFIGSKMFKSIPEHMNKFLSRAYTISGAWDNPVVKRI